MTLHEKIIAAYPDLANADWLDVGIVLRDDSDGQGAYIEKWEYDKPLPSGLKIGKQL